MNVNFENQSAGSQPDLPPDDRVVCCTWCSLPVGNGATVRQDAEPVYCCYGCRIAHAVTQERGIEGAVRWTIVRLGLAIFFTMNLMAFTMTMWSLDVYDVQADPFQLKLFEVFRWLSMIFSIPVLLLLGIPLLQNAVDSWKQRIYSTDLLIATGVASAYVISVWNVLHDIPAVYFEVGAMVLLAVTLGRWFEASGKHKATEALDQLAALLPASAERIGTLGIKVVPSTEVRAGDRLRIRAGDRFPADGVLVSGRTTVDEQVFTGESTPVERTPGDRILAGTVNLDGDIEILVTSGFREGSFGKLLKLLQDARTARGHYQMLADRVSAWFFPAVTILACVTLVAHWSSGAGNALQNALAVLLIACPCALGLATPLAVWTALSTAIRHQVLFRSGETIERLALADSICIDKTGTLSTGQPHVLRTVMNSGKNPGTSDSDDSGLVDPDFAIELAQTLAGSSRHPYSRAIVEELGETRQNSDLEICNVPGKGVEARTRSQQLIRLGNPEFCGLRTDGLVQQWVTQADAMGCSLVTLSMDEQPLMGFFLTETLRGEAARFLDQCHALEIPLTILTGDRRARAERLEQELRTRSSGQQTQTPAVALSVLSQLNPSDKVNHVLKLRESGRRTIMVGDGINDAPALAASEIGMAMGCGADVSRESAQVCLLGNDLTRIPWSIRLARQTRRVIRQNLVWAFGYNSAGVIVACLGYLNPAVAAGLMIISSLLVITNSLRLMAFDAPDYSEDPLTDRTQDQTTTTSASSAVLPAKVDDSSRGADS